MAIKTSQTKYPQTINQPYPASNRTHWKNVNNLKTKSTNLNTNYAQTNKISGKNGANPYTETIQLQNMGFNIPNYAIVTAIVVDYSYRLEAQTSGKYPSIGQPTIMMKYWGEVSEVKGVTPSKDWKTKSVTYSTNDYALPTVSAINDPYFGVEFRFPKNSSDNEGYIYLNNVSITVKYTIPDFPVDLVMIGDDNGEFVKDVPFKFQAVVNNPDLAETPPVVEITVPTGTNLSFSGNAIVSDTLTKISDTKWRLTLARWSSSYETGTGASGVNPTGTVYLDSSSAQMTVTIDTKKGNRIIELEATVPSTGNKSFTVTETRGNKYQSRSVTVIAQATPIIDDVEVPIEQAIYAIQNTPFTLPVQISSSMVGTTFYLHTDTGISILNGSSYSSVSDWYTISADKFDSTGYCELTCKTSNTGVIKIAITNDNTSLPESTSFVVRVVPEGYDIPRFTVLKLDAEEANRLGDGYNYTISADMRITCLASHVGGFVDYYRNFRIGVVNSIPTTLNVSTIFNACRNWSNGISVFNEFEKKSIDFTYNEDYPVYIIISGNYDTAQCDLFECNFGNLQVIESKREDGNLVIFPRPILNVINVEDETTSNLVLPSNQASNNLIFYDFGLEDTFNTNQNLAIRGLAVKVTASSDSTGIITAQLKSPKGLTGERSVLLNNEISHIIGGTTDRWGFSISELADLSDFELELNISNITDVENNVTIEKVELITYFIFYEKQLVDWIVEEENMAGFNVFLEDVIIPEGLKTSTKYLTVDGTDTNDAYRQNIKEKEITVKFSIDECSIDESTATLQDITQKLLTERDNLYRPIPKKVEFSHYPGIFWEYILEDTINAEAQGAGYDCKVKLTIPAGTAYNKEDTTTGKSGRVSGLAKVNPVIMVRPTAQHIEITETFTNQKFLMSYTNWTRNDIVEIDCKHRKILLHSNDVTTDITNDTADWNTDWFLLYNQFLFNETGCVIQSVTWNERK